MIFLSQSTWRWLDPVKQAIFQAIFISTHGCYRAGATASASGCLLWNGQVLRLLGRRPDLCWNLAERSEVSQVLPASLYSLAEIAELEVGENQKTNKKSRLKSRLFLNTFNECSLNRQVSRFQREDLLAPYLRCKLPIVLREDRRIRRLQRLMNGKTCLGLCQCQ